MVSTADRADVDKLFARISAVSVVAELDDNFAVVEYDEQGSLLSPHGENRQVEVRTSSYNVKTVVSNSLKFDAWSNPLLICMEKSRMHSRDSVTLSYVPSRRRDWHVERIGDVLKRIRRIH